MYNINEFTEQVTVCMDCADVIDYTVDDVFECRECCQRWREGDGELDEVDGECCPACLSSDFELVPADCCPYCLGEDLEEHEGHQCTCGNWFVLMDD